MPKARAKKPKFIVRKSKKTGKQIKLYGAPMARVLASERTRKRKNGAKRRAAERRRNVQEGFMSGGVFHPIRASRDYSSARAGEKVDRRTKTGKQGATVTARRRALRSSKIGVARVRKNRRSQTSSKPFNALIGTSPAGQFASSLGLINGRKQKNSRRGKRNPLGALLVGVNGRRRGASGQPRRRRNQEGDEGLFEQFHGRQSDGYKVGLAPIGTPRETEFLGKLECIEYRNGSKETMTFGHGDHDQPDLVSNKSGTHLYIVGDIPCWPDKTDSHHGYVTKIEYHAIKDHIDGGIKTLYFHKVGEETGELPALCVDSEGYLILKGGAYYVTADGIIN